MTDRQAIAGIAGSYVTPSLRHARVSDAMRSGVITCPPDTSMRDVGRLGPGMSPMTVVSSARAAREGSRAADLSVVIVPQSSSA